MAVRLPQLIEPYNRERVVNCSYELSMGSEAYVTGSDSKTKRVLGDREQLVVPPGQFAQLLTHEIVEVPRDSLALISMKSRLKLHGLVNVSGFHVDPGYSGRLLFSVYNAGTKDIILSQATPTFLIWYSTLDRPTEDLYDGKRAGLVEMSDEDVMRLHGDVSTPQAIAKRVAAIEELDLSKRVDVLERHLRLRDRVRGILLAVFVTVIATLIAQRVVSSLGDPPATDQAPGSQSSSETPDANPGGETSPEG